MTKEDAIKILYEMECKTAYSGELGGLAVEMAVEALRNQPSLPSNLDEAAEKSAEIEKRGYNRALKAVKEKVDELYDEASIGLSEYDSGLYNGIADTCMKLRGFIKARLYLEPEED